MRIRFLSLSLIAALLVAAVAPAAHASTAPPAQYMPAQPRADDFEPWDFCDAASHYTPARQVSGLPRSRVWVPRNLFRNRGR